MADWRPEIRARLSGSNLPAAREIEVIDELAQDLAEREAAFLRNGVPPDEARRLVLDEIADDDVLRRGLQRLPRPPAAAAAGTPATGGFSLRHLAADLRYAVRTLLRDRAYTVTAVLALAVGIGGAAAVFGVLDAVLLRPMPFPHADRLVVPVSENAARDIRLGSTSYADYADWRQLTDVFEAVALWTPTSVDITGNGNPERVDGLRVSEEFFRLVDVTPDQGRVLQPSDHEASAPAAALISHGLWQRRFGGAGVIGQTIAVSGVSYQIVGVVPAVTWPGNSEIFLPLRPSTLDPDTKTRRDNLIFQTLARLKKGVTVEQANAPLAAIAARLAQEDPSRKGWTNRVAPLREFMVGADVSRALYVLLGAVASVLLIVCANVANLSLVRGQSRVRELAIRLSLGASRGRLIQQLITESVVVALAGTALAAGVAAVVMRALVRMAPDGTPFLEAIGLDGRVLLAMMGIAIFTVLASGVLPALVISGLRLGPSLKSSTAGGGLSPRASHLRHTFVVVEVAVAVVLLVLSSLLLRSFGRLTSVNPGTDVDRVLTARVSLPAARYPRDTATRPQFYQQLAARLHEHPQVEAVAAASYVPAGTGGFGLGRRFVAEGRPDPPAAPDLDAMWNVITPEYFRTVGIRLLTGRAFSDDDRAGATPVMVVSQSFAEQMFPGESPLGRRVRSWRDENVQREIIGVVSDVHYFNLADKPQPLVYVPLAQDTWGQMVLVVRARSGDPASLAPVLQRAVGAMDPLLALGSVRTMKEAAGASIATQRYATVLLSVLASLSIMLAAVGVYGVMSYVFGLRRREMSIRLALGASAASVYRLVFRYGFTLAAAGLTIGCIGAYFASRGLSTLLYETPATDAPAWTAMAVTFTIAAALACLAPARRSANADPVSVLRGD